MSKTRQEVAGGGARAAPVPARDEELEFDRPAVVVDRQLRPDRALLAAQAGHEPNIVLRRHHICTVQAGQRAGTKGGRADEKGQLNEEGRADEKKRRTAFAGPLLSKSAHSSRSHGFQPSPVLITNQPYCHPLQVSLTQVHDYISLSLSLSFPMPASALPSLLQDLLVSNVNLAPLPSLLQDHLLLAVFSTQGRRLPLFFLLPALALIQGSCSLPALAVKQGSLLLSKAPCLLSPLNCLPPTA